MRKATISDIEFVAQCFIELSLFTKSQGSDVYIDGMPSEVNDQTRKLAMQHIKDDESTVFISTDDEQNSGCIIGKIEETSFPVSNVGKVGKIIICWVSEKYRRTGIAKRLFTEIEKWFYESGIEIIELSYLSQNGPAKKVWESLEFEPFRVFAYKTLNH
ncbi:MAG: GNAT family N-acetyltransferase [Deltaproteobacteria bacterium]|nr:GNAT family N-acetyltransferase [Deltaproteobacteria bacterium]